MSDIKPFPRRRTPGQYGGKPTQRDFWFVARDGVKYPSESVAMRSNRLPTDPNQKPSWSWALFRCASEDVWLVIPIRGDTPEDRRKDTKAQRAALWRTGTRHGFDMTSEYVEPNLYIRVVQ